MPPTRKAKFESQVQVPVPVGIVVSFVSVEGRNPSQDLVLTSADTQGAAQADTRLIQFINDLHQAATGP